MSHWRQTVDSVDKGETAVPEAVERLDEALSEHWRLARASSPEPWFEMKVVVERSGKFFVDTPSIEKTIRKATCSGPWTIDDCSSSSLQIAELVKMRGVATTAGG